MKIETILLDKVMYKLIKCNNNNYKRSTHLLGFVIADCVRTLKVKELTDRSMEI